MRHNGENKLDLLHSEATVPSELKLLTFKIVGQLESTKLSVKLSVISHWLFSSV